MGKIPKSARKLEVRGVGNLGSRTFVIGDEDHTLGNSLRHILMQNRNVSFAGYSVPHPMDPFINVRVQTVAPRNEGEVQVKATDALSDACRTLSTQCDFILSKVEEIMPEVQEDRLVIGKVADELRKMKMEEDEDDEEDDDDDDDEGIVYE